MKKLTINFTPPASAPNGYRVSYRVLGSSDPYTVALFPAGTLSPIEITGLTAGVSYEGFIETNCGFGFSAIASFSANGTIWEIDAYTCEQESVFTQTGEVTGLSSPASLMYDSVTGRVYGVDSDNVAGCFFWYDPTGFTNASQITYIPAILQVGAQNYMYGSAVDPEYRKLYACGKDSDGVQVYDIDTNTVTVIPWGCNHNVAPACGDSSVRNGYPRVFLRMIGEEIIGVDKYSNTLIAIDRNTGTQKYQINITAIPSYEKCFIGSPEILRVGNEFWVTSSQGNSSEAPAKLPHIYKYNLTFTVLNGYIDMAGKSSTWSGGSYFRAVYLDAVNNKYYLFDGGSTRLTIVDTTTSIIVSSTQLAVRQGKTNGFFSFIIDVITDELYLSGNYMNQVSDSSPIPMTYKINRLTQDFEAVYGQVTFTRLERIAGTNELHGPSTGQLAWSGNSGWGSDGKIIKFTR